MRELSPSPIDPNDKIQTAQQAEIAAKKECPEFQQILVGAELHGDKWFVQWKRGSVIIDKRDGAATPCAGFEE